MTLKNKKYDIEITVLQSKERTFADRYTFFKSFLRKS